MLPIQEYTGPSLPESVEEAITRMAPAGGDLQAELTVFAEGQLALEMDPEEVVDSIIKGTDWREVMG